MSVGGQEDEGPSRATTPTPKRASYLSPTKSSLARSNPQLLQNSAHAKKSRESEPNRRKSLRDAVLGNKSLLPTEEHAEMPSLEIDSNPASVNVEPISPSPPPRMEIGVNNAAELRSPVTLNRGPQNHHSSSSRIRSSVTPRRHDSRNAFVSSPIVPTLVDSPRRGERRRSESVEVELPPTPVQLGKGILPDRPRGLISSSPGGRGTRKVKTRGGDIYSSPLKPKAMAPTLSESEEIEQDVEIASGLGGEDQDHLNISDIERGGMVEVSQAAPDARRKTPAPDISPAQHSDPADRSSNVDDRKNELKALQEELSALQEDLQQLEVFRTNLSRGRGMSVEPFEAGFKIILKDTNHDMHDVVLPTDTHPLFQKHPTAYLSLFSPESLAMTYKTWERSIAGRQKFVYQTTLLASKPWPLDSFTLTLDAITDWESRAIESIVLMTDPKKHPELSRWVEQRLQDPLLNKDIATLVTGAGRFFEAMVDRAKVWKTLIEPSAASIDNTDNINDGNPTAKKSSLSQQDVFGLLPFLNTRQHTFTPADSRQRLRRSLGGAKQLMLSYEITLDWVGRVDVSTEIFTTGFNSPTTEAARKLFADVKAIAGVVEAFKEVKSLMGMDESATSGGTDGRKANGIVVEKIKARKGRARRMTVFD